MENEENKSLINKKDYEDQFTEFCQFNLGALSIFSFSHTLGHVEFSWSTLGGVWHTWSLGARRQRKRRKAQEDINIRNYNGFSL